MRPPSLGTGLADLARRIEPTVTALAVLSSPWRDLRPIKPLAFTYSDMIFCLSLLLLLAGRRLPRSPFGEISLLWFAGFGLLVGGLLLGSLAQGDIVRWLSVMSQYFFALILLSFILLSREPAEMNLFLKAFIAGVVVMNLLGIAAYFTGWDPTGRMVSGSKRLQALIGDPNACAHMIALSTPLLVYLWVTGNISSLVVAVILPIQVSAVFMTGSVNGLATTSLAVVLLAAAMASVRVLLRFAAGIVVLVALLGALGTEHLPHAFQKRVLGALQSGNIEQAGTFNERLVLLREAAEKIDVNPLLGIGTDQFREISSIGRPVHNIYFLTWVEGGLLALVGWLLLLAVPTILALLNYQLTRRRFASAITFVVGSVLALVAVNNAYMYARFWLVPLNLAMAVSLNSIRAFKADRAAEAGRPSKTGWASGSRIGAG